jgi:hypothetical protein
MTRGPIIPAIVHFMCGGLLLANWPSLAAIQPNVQCNQRTSCILGALRIGHHNVIPLNIQASSESFSGTPPCHYSCKLYFAEPNSPQVRLDLVHWQWDHGMAHQVLCDLASVLRHLLSTKTAIYGRDLALSVGVLALTLALPLGSKCE